MPKDYISPKDHMHTLYRGALGPKHFLDWKAQTARIAAFNSLGIGALHWQKSLGRPETPTLSEAFHFEAHQEQCANLTTIPGTVEFKRVAMSRDVTWWDGEDDDEHWRVVFLVSGLTSGHTHDPTYNLYTDIVPAFVSGVHWAHPGGDLAFHSSGYRAIDPAGAHFVMGDEAVFLEFELVTKPWLVVHPGGIVKP